MGYKHRKLCWNIVILKSSHHPCLKFLLTESHIAQAGSDLLHAENASNCWSCCYHLNSWNFRHKLPSQIFWEFFVCFFGFSCFCFYSLLIHWLCMWVCVHALVSRHLAWVGCLLPHGSWRLNSGCYDCQQELLLVEPSPHLSFTLLLKPSFTEYN